MRSAEAISVWFMNPSRGFPYDTLGAGAVWSPAENRNGQKMESLALALRWEWQAINFRT